MTRITVLAVVLLTLATGCKEKQSPAPAPVPVAQTQPPGEPKVIEASVKVDPDSAVLDQLPVAEDFEEQAKLAITSENLDSEIANLEREMTE